MNLKTVYSRKRQRIYKYIHVKPECCLHSYITAGLTQSQSHLRIKFPTNCTFMELTVFSSINPVLTTRYECWSLIEHL